MHRGSSPDHHDVHVMHGRLHAHRISPSSELASSKAEQSGASHSTVTTATGSLLLRALSSSLPLGSDDCISRAQAALQRGYSHHGDPWLTRRVFRTSTRALGRTNYCPCIPRGHSEHRSRIRFRKQAVVIYIVVTTHQFSPGLDVHLASRRTAQHHELLHTCVRHASHVHVICHWL